MEDLYSPFSKMDCEIDDKYGTVVNCFAHMISHNKIDVNKFEVWMKYGAIGGDISWGIEKWNEDSKDIHGIDEEYTGYLFYIGKEEHMQSEYDHHKILTKEQIKPFLNSIISYYLKKDIENNTGVHNLIILAKEYGFICSNSDFI